VYNIQSQQRSCTVPPALAQLPTPSNPEACEPCASHQTPGLTQWTASHAQATVCVCCLVLTQYPYLPPRRNLWCGGGRDAVGRCRGRRTETADGASAMVGRRESRLLCEIH
jgi:hypothetical protein